MNSVDYLKRRYVNNVMDNDPRFTYSRDEQEKILSKYNEPSNLIERSYFQYKCQTRMLGWKRFLYQICALPILLYKLLTVNKKKEKKRDCDLLCFMAGVGKDTIPEELIKNYSNIMYYKADEGELLTKEDIRWFISNVVAKYPIEFFFQLKILLRLLNYSYMISSFNPVAIATHSEYSCGSSAMTEYCHYRRIKHINYMHGEKLWYIRDSFFCFDKCYIWDMHYKKIFTSLKAVPEQFVIAIPPKFLSPKREGFIINEAIVESDYCYYLANESHEQIDAIYNCLNILIAAGNKVRVRMHPRWGDHDYILIKSKEAGINIEDAGVDINQSILKTKNAISLFSTVLFQSHLLNIPIIIDDVSNVEHFRRIKELDYIAFSYPHRLLSVMLNEIGNK